MVVNNIMDVDKFLTKNDFSQCLHYRLIWPWTWILFQLRNVLVVDIITKFIARLITKLCKTVHASSLNQYHEYCTNKCVSIQQFFFGANIVGMLRIITINMMNVNTVILFYFINFKETYSQIHRLVQGNNVEEGQ